MNTANSLYFLLDTMQTIQNHWKKFEDHQGVLSSKGGNGPTMTMRMTWYQDATGKKSSNDSFRVSQCLHRSLPTGNEIKDNETQEFNW